MGNFSNLKKVDLPYKSTSLQFKEFVEESMAPFYEFKGKKKVEDDDLTILDDFEFQNVDLGNIRQDEFVIDSDDSDEECETKSELNFQEYSVSYMKNDSTIQIINYKKDVIDVEEINKQAQSSPKLQAENLNSMIYNMSLDELDFQLRGDEEQSLDSKEKDESFDIEHLLGSISGDLPEYDQSFEEVLLNDNDVLSRDEHNNNNTQDSMDVDVVLPPSSSPSSVTSTDDEFIPTFEKLNGFLKSPQFPAKVSKIPVRFVADNNRTSQFRIYHDPVKQQIPTRIRPVSLYQHTLKKSTRLPAQEYSRLLKSPKRVCSPKKSIAPLKSALRVRKNLLNLIVDAASGDQREAARYGTEINSQNCEGVPLPESTKELVTIPTNNAKETNKAAIIKAISPMVNDEPKLRDITRAQNEFGFYSEKDFQKYLATKDSTANGKENEMSAKRPKIEAENASKKHIRWAESLEW